MVRKFDIGRAVLLAGMLTFLSIILGCNQTNRGTPAVPSDPIAVSQGNSPALDQVPTATGAGEVAMTVEEAKELEYNRLQIENLNFKIGQLRERIMDAKQKLAKENADLLTKSAAAHNLDQKRYQCDQNRKVWVPITATTKKPAEQR